MASAATIVIPARNAAPTIERAVRSALLQGDYPIVLVDDFSTDNTVSLATNLAGPRLKIVRPAVHQSLGLTRQTGLDAVETPFGVWLDADDEMLPGRVDRIVAALSRDSADLAADAIELFDGPTSRFLRHLAIPHFLKDRNPLARLFERNYLQGVGCLGFSTIFAKSVGFDTQLHGAEDMDFALRSLAKGANFVMIDEPGYRIFTYPTSMSRRRENQLEMYRLCLSKHSYKAVSELFHQAGYDPRVRAWGLASMAMFRHDFTRVLEYVGKAESLTSDFDEVLEPAGPCPMPEGWRAAFFRGSAMSMLNLWPEAEFWLTRAERIQTTPEGLNNLGVALANNGKAPKSHECFRLSLERLPDYADAGANQESPAPSRITLHPLRREPSRRDYL